MSKHRKVLSKTGGGVRSEQIVVSGWAARGGLSDRQTKPGVAEGACHSTENSAGQRSSTCERTEV